MYSLTFEIPIEMIENYRISVSLKERTEPSVSQNMSIWFHDKMGKSKLERCIGEIRKGGMREGQKAAKTKWERRN